jgi:hypothetical protein
MYGSGARSSSTHRIAKAPWIVIYDLVAFHCLEILRIRLAAQKGPRPKDTPVKKTRALGPAGHRSVVASRELNTMTKSSHLAMHILKVRKQVFDNDDT